MKSPEIRTTANSSKASANQSFKGSASLFPPDHKSFIQPKLTVNQPNDTYEQEADRTADKVVKQINEPSSVQTKAEPIVKNGISLVQKKCTNCEEEKLQKKEEEHVSDEKLQRQFFSGSIPEPPPGDKGNMQPKFAPFVQERLQTKSEPLSLRTPSSNIENSLSSSKGSGFPLPGNTRQQMESSFGADFSSVRIHTDTSAVQMSKEIHAQAFTHGGDIYFNEGKYDPSSSQGQHLLAHELTHTVQQGASKSVDHGHNNLVSRKNNIFRRAEDSLPIPFTNNNGPTSDLTINNSAEKENISRKKEVEPEAKNQQEGQSVQPGIVLSNSHVAANGTLHLSGGTAINRIPDEKELQKKEENIEPLTLLSDPVKDRAPPLQHKENSTGALLVHRSIEKDNNIHSKEDVGHGEKIQAQGLVYAPTVVDGKAGAIGNSATSPGKVINRVAEVKELQKKEEHLEEKESLPPARGFLINRKSISKNVDPDIDGYVRSNGIVQKWSESKSTPLNIHVAKKATVATLSTNTVRERGPPIQSVSVSSGEKAVQSSPSDSFNSNAGIFSPGSFESSMLVPGLIPYSQVRAVNTVQRDEEPPGDSAPAEESLLDQLKGGIDATLRLILPESAYSFYSKIKDGGIVNLIKDAFISLITGLFTKLGFSTDQIQIIFQTFLQLKAQLPAIINGLSKGDCKPLFDALNVLSQVVGEIAGVIWDNLMAEIEPIRLWLIEIWETFAAPVIDEITAFAGEQWEMIKGLGKFIWDSFQPIREAGDEAWNWVVEKLGFGTTDEPGLMGYVSGKLTEAWENIKAELKPVIDPINVVIEGIKSLVSLTAIKKLQEDAKKWLDEVVKTATAMGEDEDAVANKQITLRQVLLPALNNAIDSLKTVLIEAGQWILEKISIVTDSAGSFISSFQANTYLSSAYPLISWLPQIIDGLKDWASDKVTSLFDMLQQGVEYLKKFVEPLLSLLEKLVTVVGNLLKYLPDLILGVPFMLMPRCIKDPIIKWITEVILKQIPIISEFISLTEKWEEIKTAALTVLKQVFIDGQFAKALWTYYKMLLNILGIDPKLVTAVIAKTAQNFSDIISKPGAFLSNIWKAIKGGFSLFFENILIHLPKGALEWLFGEVKGATKVEPPKDFSVGSIFGFVLTLFGITKDNVYERMSLHPKIGKEKVEQIKKIEKTLTGVLEWISLWIKEGAEGLLKKIKNDLGDLKNMVIQGVVSWITTSIVAEITKKLMTSVDPLGIGAFLNTIKLLYDTLKTAVAYVNRMLNIVSSVMDSVAEIISGNTKAASEYLEGILAKAVPFVVGFAVQVIIGPIGEKIKEIVDGVRKKIDSVIDSLINGAVGFIESVIKTGTQVVGAILGWLGLKKEFTTPDGESHKLYFEGSEDNPVLMIRSNPTAYKTFITNLNVGTDEKKNSAKKEAVPIADDIDKKRREGLDGATKEEKEKSKEKKLGEVDDLLGKLAIPSAVLFGDLSNVGEPEVVNTVQGSGHGITMAAKKLNNKQKLKGSPPTSADTASYAILNTRRQSASASYYVKGHMLNDNIGGKGVWENLTPLSREGNSGHEGRVESLVKAAYNSGAVIEYNIIAKYGYGNNASSIPADDSQREQKLKIINEEKNVPTALQCDAWILEKKGDAFERTQSIVSASVNNPIGQDATSYILEGGPARDDIYLNTSDVSAIATIDNFGGTMAGKVKKAHIESGKSRFNSYSELSNAKMKDGTQIFSSDDEKKKIMSLPDLKYVKLYKSST